MSIKAATHISVDDTAFLAHLKDYSKVMGKSMDVVIREQAGLFCVDMIGFTRPFTKPGAGQTAESKKKGFENVANSVNHIFRPVIYGTPQQIASMGSLDVFKMWEKRNSALGIAGTSKKVRWRQFQAKYAGGTAPQFIPAGDLAAIGALHTSKRQDGGRGPLTLAADKAKEPFALVEREKDLKD